MNSLLAKLRALFRRKSLEAEMADEMRQHLERRIQEKITNGLTPDEARYAAQREFGGIAQVQEQCRDERRWVWLEQGMQDLRYAARQSRRNPGFTTVAVATLAIGIGATTAIFSVVHGLLLKPLPYEQPGQLVQIFESSRPGDQNVVSPGLFFDWRTQGASFEGLAAYTGRSLNFNGGAEPERVDGLRMSANGLQLLRAQPLAGRLFTADEDQIGRANVIVLTYRLWQRAFGGDREVIGRSILLDDQNYTVIGILPDQFLPVASQEFVIPLALDPSLRENRDGHWLRVLARLKPGVPMAQVQAELDTISARIRPLLPTWKQGWGTTIVPMHEQLVQSIKPALLVLLGAVALVLLIGCANVANLLLAKASARQREMAVRGALGASRGRIARQLLAESLLLALLGALLGLLLAFWSVHGLRHLLGAMNIARVHEIAVDPVVLGVAAAVSLLTGIAFGLAPALQSSRTDLNHALKDAARGSATAGRRLRNALIVGEVALALMLLVGAGLLLHSFARLLQVPPGFNAENALTLQLSLSGPKYPDNAQRIAFFNRVAAEVGALPGVEAAGLAQTLPLRGAPSVLFRIAGRVNQPEHGYSPLIDFCTPDYFRAMGIPLLRGRGFTLHEAASGARVAIINATAARHYFDGEEPLGQFLQRDHEKWEIIGIAGDVRMNGLSREVRPLVYRLASGPSEGWSSAVLVVRTRMSPLAAVDPVRQRLREIDPAQPIANVRTLEEVLAASVAERRLTLGLLVAFAVVALLLAAMGLYGVIAYAVGQRTREFGIRIALGASRHDVRRLVMGQGMTLAAIGLALGLAGALSFSHLLTKLLYEIKPTDPATLAGVSLVLLVVALIASWLPARRAAKVDPMTALRAE